MSFIYSVSLEKWRIFFIHSSSLELLLRWSCKQHHLQAAFLLLFSSFCCSTIFSSSKHAKLKSTSTFMWARTAMGIFRAFKQLLTRSPMAIRNGFVFMSRKVYTGTYHNIYLVRKLVFASPCIVQLRMNETVYITKNINCEIMCIHPSLVCFTLL